MQTYNLDLSIKRVVPLLNVKQRDVGTKICVVLTDNREQYNIPEDTQFSVWFSGRSGDGNYAEIDGQSAFSIEDNKVTVELIYQMLTNPGEHVMCLVMNDADGKQQGLWNIPYFVEAIPGADSQAATAYYQAFLKAQENAEAAADRAEAAAEKIQLDQEYFDTVVFAVDQSAEIAASAARDAAAAKQSAKDDADRADDASKRAEEVAGSVGSPVSYKAQTLTKEEQAQARGNLGLTVFGAPYSSATKVIDISAGGDGSVKLYLFTVAEGFDAVVSGAGAIADYTEDNRPYDAQSISRLHIEKGITSIGSYFMQGAYNLKKLSFEDSKAITHLGAYAFAITQIDGTYDFSGLKDSALGNAFWCCPKLEGLSFNANIKTIAANAFQFCLVLRYVNGIAGVTQIGAGAFHVCTSLEYIDVEPGEVSLGKWAFVSTPIDAKAGNTTLSAATWASKGELCFVQEEWTTDQLTAIRAVTADSMAIPVPESDNQKTDFYKQWGVFPMVFKGEWYENGHPASGCCGIFNLFHIYNILHPNAQYDTFYDFITREIKPKKIKVTEELANALEQRQNGQILIANNTDVSYEVGSEILATDLPMALDDDTETWGEIGTSHWGACEVLGWSARETLFESGTDSGATVKQTILNNLAEGKPVMMEIVFAADSGHGMHAVTAIGYDKGTDKLLIIDSTWEYPSDIVPMVYWLPFEVLISPNSASAIWTYDFGEVITMTDIDNKLDALMESLNSGFHIESGQYVLDADKTDNDGDGVADAVVNITVPCPNGAKLFVFQPDEDTLKAIRDVASKADEVNWTVGVLGNCGKQVGRTSNRGYMQHMHVYKENWTTAEVGCACDNTDGFKFGTYGLKAGTYNWTAYYWKEKEE